MLFFNVEVLKQQPAKSIWILFQIKLEKQTKFATYRDLWKYGSIWSIQKFLTIKWLRFSKTRFFIWVYNLIINHILSPNNKLKMWISIKFSILWCSNQTTNLYFLISKVHYLSQMIFFSINNYIIIFIIKLLV